MQDALNAERFFCECAKNAAMLYRTANTYRALDSAYQTQQLRHRINYLQGAS